MRVCRAGCRPALGAQDGALRHRWMTMIRVISGGASRPVVCCHLGNFTAPGWRAGQKLRTIMRSTSVPACGRRRNSPAAPGFFEYRHLLLG